MNERSSSFWTRVKRWILPWLIGFFCGVGFTLTCVAIYWALTFVGEVEQAVTGIKIVSDNEPEDDAKAFSLVGMTKPPGSKVLYRKFEAGMDDCMRMVFELPRDQVDAFWESSPFAGETRREVFPSDPAKQGGPGLTRTGDPLWSEWTRTDRGFYAQTALGGGQFATIYIALDGTGPCRCFLWWQET